MNDKKTPCKCFGDSYDKLRVYCNNCGCPYTFELITPQLIEEELKQGIDVSKFTNQEVMNFDSYDEYKTILRKCKIDYLLSIK